jgi:hypothetical protein
MKNRLDEVPVYEFKQGEIESHYYNHVKIAINRINKEIRFEIPDLKHLDLILDEHAWIIVDRVHADLPIAAWTEFEITNRSSLHGSIKCRIQLYHYMAHMILERTLDAMESMIEKELTVNYVDDENKIIPFRKNPANAN